MSNPRSLTRKLTAGVCVAFALCLAEGAAAQPSEENHPVTVSAAGGFTGVVGQDAGRLDHGGNFQLGAGHFFNDYLVLLCYKCLSRKGISSQAVLVR